MPKAQTTALRAVLFTDVVGSTELARELGDERWARLLAAQRRIVRERLRAHRGKEIDTAGDGFFAVFDGPADAIRCGFGAARDVQELGLDIRAGVHFGEIETSGNDAHGIVVHTGARVMGQAGAAEVLTTQTVKDLVAGARFDLRERATTELKGIPGEWTLFDVMAVDDELRPEPIEGATVASERRERASARGARPVSRRNVVVVAIAAVVAIVAAAVVVLKPSPTYVPSAGTVARIEGDRFAKPISVGSFPLDVAEGSGRVWIADRQSQLYWVDETDGSTGSRGTNGVPTGVTVGGGSVWITAGFGGGNSADESVSRFEVGSGQLATAFSTPIGSKAIAYGAGAVWVADTNTGSVTRYDPVGRSSNTIELSGSARPGSIAFATLGGDSVWVGDSISNNVYRVDASGSNAVHTYTVGATPTAIAIGTDGVWVLSQSADSLYELDASSGFVRTTVALGPRGCNGPVSLAVVREGVWVACSTSERVIRLPPDGKGAPTILKVNGNPAAIAAAPDGSVWVAVQPR